MSLRGEVQITVCGQPRSIAPTFRAIEAIESRLDVSIFKLIDRIVERNLRVRDIAVIVYEGLKGAGHSGGNGKGEAHTLDEIGEDVMVNVLAYSKWVGEFVGNAVGGKPSTPKKARGAERP